MPTATRTAAVADIDGELIALIDLEHRWGYLEPPDHLALFRSTEGWTAVTIRRTDATDRAPASARVTVESVTSTAELATTIRNAYAEHGWRSVLDAAKADPTIYPEWAAMQIERDLDHPIFFLPDDRTDDGATGNLLPVIARGIESMGFTVAAIEPPRRLPERGENRLLAQAALRRYGMEADVVVRIDCAGEVYARLDPDTEIRPVEVEDDD